MRGTTPECLALPSATGRLAGTVWNGSIHPLESTASVWTDSWPIGALTASGLGAVEVFKAVVRQIQLRQREPYWKEFVDPCRRASWDWDPGKELFVPKYLDMGVFDMVSAGAIVQAIYFVLMRLPHVRFQSTIFEDDATEITNLNRNLLTRARHIGMNKGDVVRSYDIDHIHALHERLTKTNINALRPEACVLVGADDIPTRWLVQRCSPRWLGVAGTSHFGALISSHVPGEPCAGTCEKQFQNQKVISNPFETCPTAKILH